MKRGVFLFIVACSTFVYGELGENLGQFRFSEFSLNPRLKIQEPGQGNIEIQKTWLGFEWQKDEIIRGQMWLGSSDLSTAAIWFSPVTRPDFGIVEAYLEGKSSIGDFRAGLLNVHQGFEGSRPEWAWPLPTTRVRSQGWLIQRDFGFQFRFHTAPYTTIITAHNGESGSNSDGKFWTSGLWKFQDSQGFGALLTASVGNTNSSSTSSSVAGNTTNRFKFVANEDSKVRYGTLGLYRDDDRSLFLFEVGKGEILQTVKGSFAWGHLDLSWYLGGDFNVLMRYEQSQSDLDLTATIFKSTSLGLVYSSRDRLQSITVMATQNQETPENNNNEYYVIFRLNSRYLN